MAQYFEIYDPSTAPYNQKFLNRAKSTNVRSTKKMPCFGSIRVNSDFEIAIF